MANFIEDIKDFHKRFGLEYKGPPRDLPTELSLFRIRFMQEELNEYTEAIGLQDRTKQLDALVDLMYVLLGTAHLHGWNKEFAEAWSRVHYANMQKVRAEREEDSVRGSVAFDVVKPPGWKPADLSDLV